MGDVISVCRTAYPADAAHWITSLVTTLPECTRSSSMRPADQGWLRAGARFRTSTGAVVSLPGAYSAGAREMYCRNVYLRSGLRMPTAGWVLDLGANRGLFSVWAALTGAQVVAVEAQRGFAADILGLAEHNGVAERVHVEVAMAGGVTISGGTVGDIADDDIWRSASHADAARPAGVSVPGLMSAYRIDRVGLIKMDIEGGEYAVLAAGEDLRWLERVDQLVLEVHPSHGDAAALIERIRLSGFTVDLRDNDGLRVGAGSVSLDYAYCRRS
jgi:FkbM family methyltransferase